MDTKKISSVIISDDEALHRLIHGAIRASGNGIVVDCEIRVPCSGIGKKELAELNEAEPDLVFLDVEADPLVGFRFVRFVTDSAPHRRFVVLGPELGSDMLVEAMRAGASDYLPKPADSSSLVDAVSRAKRKLAGPAARADPATPAEITTVFSPKGGSGSTTVATNLAVHLRRITGAETLLIDLDPRLGDAATLLGAQPRFSFVDLVRNLHRMDAELLGSYVERHSSGVHLLAGPLQPDGAEPPSPEQVGRVIELAREHYAHVVVDTSNSFTASALAALEHSDRILLVTTLDLPSLRNIKRCMPMLERVAGPGAEKVQLVANRYDPTDPITLEEVGRVLGMDVRWTLSNDYATVGRALNSGEPAVLSGRSPFARDLMAMGSQIGGVKPRGNGRRGRLSSLRSLFSRAPEVSAHA